MIVHDGLNIGDLLLEERFALKCILQTSKSVMAVSTERRGRRRMGVVGVITRDGSKSCVSHCVFESGVGMCRIGTINWEWECVICKRS